MSQKYPTISCDEEAAPLVPNGNNRDWDNYPSRLENPTVEYEVESELFSNSNEQPKTSNFATMMHLLKGNIGTGILAMPSAIANAGLLVGTLGIPLLGVICIHCMHLLVNNSKVLCKKVGCRSLDYASTAEQAFRHGPKKLQKFTPFARFFVNFMLMLTQFGFCCVYFLFVSSSIYEVVFSLTGTKPIGTKGYMLIMLPIMILFNFIRSLKKLSPASSVANVLQVVGLCFLFYYLLTDIPHYTSQPYTAPLSKLPLYFGTAMYAFEGIGVVLPLENAMATPKDFRGLNGVLNTGMVIIASLYTAVGFFGNLKYGQEVKASVTFSLPSTIGSEVIRLLFALAIFLSYALQLYVPLQIILPSLKKRFSFERFSSAQQTAIECFIRAGLVTITFVMAAAIPMLNLFISLVGALASCSLALICPPIIELVTVWNSNISRKWLCVLVIKDISIVSFGILGSVLGTYTSVSEIVECFHTKACDQ